MTKQSEETLQEITDLVCSVTGKSLGQLKQRTRKRPIVFARQLIMSTALRRGIKPDDAASLFGLHRTIPYHSDRAIETYRTMPEFYRIVQRVRAEFAS
jgi:chromosomal replication initiation ATPase DnaA